MSCGLAVEASRRLRTEVGAGRRRHRRTVPRRSLLITPNYGIACVSVDTPTLAFSSETLGHLLSDRWLAVPRYQRPYAWESEHVAEFWNDLRSAHADSRQYFLGAVVLTHDGDRFLVIDGQQRLATASLLLAAIRDELASKDEDALAEHVEQQYLARFNPASRRTEPRLLVAAADSDFYEQRFIRRAGGTAASASQRRLTAAFEYLRKEIADAQMDASGLLAWAEYLSKSALIVLVEAASEADAFQIFETLNDRGAPLTIADLLKNYLLSLCPGEPDKIADAWDSSANNLGHDADTQDFVTFIRHYWSSVKGATRERDLYRSLRASISEGDAAADFVSDLGIASELYAAILDPRHQLWGEFSLTPHAMSTLLYLQLQQYRPLILAALEHFATSDIETLSVALVSWSVRGLIVGGIGGGTTERAYAMAGVNIRLGKLADAREVYNQLRPTIPSDEEFRNAFESASIPRVRLAQYILRSLNRSLEGQPHAGLENASETSSHPVLSHVLPRRTDPVLWPRFATDDMASHVNRIGNLCLRQAGRVTQPSDWEARKEWLLSYDLPINAQLRAAESWSPEAIRHRQHDMAAIAVGTWPRSGGTV